MNIGLIINIMIIATCFQCLDLAGYKSPSELKKTDKMLFIILPFTMIFWILVKRTKNMEK